MASVTAPNAHPAECVYNLPRNTAFLEIIVAQLYYLYESCSAIDKTAKGCYNYGTEMLKEVAK